MHSSIMKGLSALIGVMALSVSFWHGSVSSSSSQVRSAEDSILEFSQDSYLEGDGSNEIHLLISKMDKAIAETDLSAEELGKRKERALRALSDLKVDVRSFISNSKSELLHAEDRKQSLNKLIADEKAEISGVGAQLEKSEQESKLTLSSLANATEQLVRLQNSLASLATEQEALVNKIQELQPVLAAWNSAASEKQAAIESFRKSITEVAGAVGDLRTKELELQTEINTLRAEEARRNAPRKKKKKKWYEF